MSTLFLACVAATTTATTAASTPAPSSTGSAEQSILAIDDYRLQTFLHDLPSGGTFSSIFEQVTPPALPLTEDAGGFGALDPERISLMGESWTWTRWRIDGHDVTDPLDPGSAAVHLPFAWTREISIGMTSQPQRTAPSGVDLAPDLDYRGVSAGLRAVDPTLGGITPGAVEIMNAISGRHANDRAIPPPTERRRYKSRLDAWAKGGGRFLGGDVTAAAEVTDTARRFLDFDPVTGALARPFDEPATRVTLGAAWQSGPARLMLLFEHQDRANLGAEAGFSQAETMASTTDALVLAGHYGDAHAALTLKRYDLSTADRGATREILDPDGEGTQPWQPDGERLAIALDAGWSSGPYYLSLQGRVLALIPETLRWSNPLTFAGAPYGRIDWSAADTTVGAGELRIGHHDGVELGGGVRLDWDLYGWAALAGRLLQIDLGADLSLSARWGDFEPFMLGSKAPIAPPTNVAIALAPGWLEGRTFIPRSGQIDSWGGSRLDIDPNIAPTHVYTGAIGLAWHISPTWRIQAQGLLESFDHTLWIESPGAYIAEGDTHFLAPGEKRYLLTNLHQDAPLYFGAELQLMGANSADYLVSVTFTVYNIVGRTPPGNGPLANDPGILDRTTANPDTDLRGLANLDADRGFLTKVILGRRFVDTLWGFMTIRHRDGEPFAFPVAHESTTGQVSILSDSPRGSPFHYSRPLAGPREDFLFDVDVELSWSVVLEAARLDLSMMVANLLDMGNELGEVQVSPARMSRGALEAQIPRSLVLGLAVELP